MTEKERRLAKRQMMIGKVKKALDLYDGDVQKAAEHLHMDESRVKSVKEIM